jgi:hypothetical protein
MGLSERRWTLPHDPAAPNLFRRYGTAPSSMMVYQPAPACGWPVQAESDGRLGPVQHKRTYQMDPVRHSVEAGFDIKASINHRQKSPTAPTLFAQMAHVH